MAKNKNKYKDRNMSQEEIVEGQEPVVQDENIVDDTEAKDATEPVQEDNIVEPAVEPEEKEEVPSQIETEEKEEEEEKDLVAPEAVNSFEELEAKVKTSESMDEVLESMTVSSDISIKLLGSELLSFINAYKANNEKAYTDANKKLNSILTRVLSDDNYEVFKVKFLLVNKLFLANDAFEPSKILQFEKWSRSEKELSNFSQLVIIVETLCNPETRNLNKKSIANLTNLSISEKALENLKQFYRL